MTETDFVSKLFGRQPDTVFTEALRGAAPDRQRFADRLTGRGNGRPFLTQLTSRGGATSGTRLVEEEEAGDGLAVALHRAAELLASIEQRQERGELTPGEAAKIRGHLRKLLRRFIHPHEAGKTKPRKKTSESVKPRRQKSGVISLTEAIAANPHATSPAQLDGEFERQQQAERAGDLQGYLRHRRKAVGF